MRLDDTETLFQAIDSNPAHEHAKRRREIVLQGWAAAHNAYLKEWRARMRAALQVSPVYGQYVR